LLGNNKTWRGIFFGIIASILAAYMQYFLYRYEYFSNLSFIDYSSYSFVMIGFLFGAGALCGDIVESFFKRQLNIKPGRPFPPFDQIDWIFGSLLFISIVYIPSYKIIIVCFVLFSILHVITKRFGCLIGTDVKKW